MLRYYFRLTTLDSGVVVWSQWKIGIANDNSVAFKQSSINKSENFGNRGLRLGKISKTSYFALPRPFFQNRYL